MHGTTLATRPFFSLTCHPECGYTPWAVGAGWGGAAAAPGVRTASRPGPRGRVSEVRAVLLYENIETVFEVASRYPRARPKP